MYSFVSSSSPVSLPIACKEAPALLSHVGYKGRPGAHLVLHVNHTEVSRVHGPDLAILNTKADLKTSRIERSL